MLTYDVLAALWNAPATEVEVARAVEDRLGTPVGRTLIDHYLQLLRTTGFVRTRNCNGIAAYLLTDDGSELLSKLATRIDARNTSDV